MTAALRCSGVGISRASRKPYLQVFPAARWEASPDEGLRTASSLLGRKRGKADPQAPRGSPRMLRTGLREIFPQIADPLRQAVRKPVADLDAESQAPLMAALTASRCSARKHLKPFPRDGLQASPVARQGKVSP